MNTSTVQTSLIILTAGEGKLLTNGQIAAREAIIPSADQASLWRESDESEWDESDETEWEDTAERDATERQIVALILQMALRHDAINDIVQMDDITIPNLEALAVSKGVLLDGDEFRTLITTITPLKWQLEAIEDTTWARCWQGLKSRFPMYVEQILAEQQAQA